MNEEEKMEKIAELLDTDLSSLTPDTQLDALEWDSMAMLGVIALAKANGKTVTGTQVRSFQTVSDLLSAAF